MALVCGHMKNEQGEIDKPIGRHPKHRTLMAIDGDAPREAGKGLPGGGENPLPRGLGLLRVRIEPEDLRTGPATLQVAGEPSLLEPGGRLLELFLPAR